MFAIIFYSCSPVYYVYFFFCCFQYLLFIFVFKELVCLDLGLVSFIFIKVFWIFGYVIDIFYLFFGKGYSCYHLKFFFCSIICLFFFCNCNYTNILPVDIKPQLSNAWVGSFILLLYFLAIVQKRCILNFFFFSLEMYILLCSAHLSVLISHIL